MDKRQELNLEIKLSLSNAIFILMKNKALSDIKIIDIVKKAGVARASYYRNFDSKEEIVDFFLMYILVEYKKEFAPNLSHITRFENLKRTFNYIKNYSNQLEALFNSGFSQYFLKAINTYMIDNTIPHLKSIQDQYNLYTYSGALFNVIYIWITSGLKESTEEITTIFFESLKFGKI